MIYHINWIHFHISIILFVLSVVLNFPKKNTSAFVYKHQKNSKMFMCSRFLMAICAVVILNPISISARITDERYLNYKDNDQNFEHLQHAQLNEYSQFAQQNEHAKEDEHLQHVQPNLHSLHNEESDHSLHAQDDHSIHGQESDHSLNFEESDHLIHGQGSEESLLHSQHNDQSLHAQLNEQLLHAQHSEQLFHDHNEHAHNKQSQHIQQHENSQRIHQNKVQGKFKVLHTENVPEDNEKQPYHVSLLIGSSNEVHPNQHKIDDQQKSSSSHVNIELQPVNASSNTRSTNKDYQQHNKKTNENTISNISNEFQTDYNASTQDLSNIYKSRSQHEELANISVNEENKEFASVEDEDEDEDYMTDDEKSIYKRPPSIAECTNAFLSTASNTLKSIGSLSRATRDVGRQTRSVVESIAPYAILSSTAMQAVSFVTPIISFLANGGLQLLNLAGYGISAMGTGMSYGAGLVSETGNLVQRSSDYGPSILGGAVAGGIALIMLSPYIFELFMSLLVTLGLKTVSGVAYTAKGFMTHGSTMDTIFEMIAVFANNLLADYNGY